MARGRRWRVRLAAAAEDDFQNILRWTPERVGEALARLHAKTLTQAIETRSAGPRVAGSRRRDEIGEGLMTLHVARGGRQGRHLVLSRVGAPANPPVIDVLRLLHDSMDLPRHIGVRGEDGR